MKRLMIFFVICMMGQKSLFANIASTDYVVNIFEKCGISVATPQYTIASKQWIDKILESINYYDLVDCPDINCSGVISKSFVINISNQIPSCCYDDKYSIFNCPVNQLRNCDTDMCEQPKFTVQFDEQGGTNVPGLLYLIYGNKWLNSGESDISSIATRTKPFHTYAGVWSEPNCQGTQIVGTDLNIKTDISALTFTKSDSVVYVCWNGDQDNITQTILDANGGAPIGTSLYSDYVTNTWFDSAGNIITSLQGNYTKSGYFLDGFYTNSDCTGTKIIDSKKNLIATPFSVATVDTTIYACWGAQYAISFDPDGGAPTGGLVYLNFGTGWLNSLKDDIITRISPRSKPGYKLVGWYSGKNCHGVKILDSDQNLLMDDAALTFTNADTTIYACWI